MVKSTKHKVKSVNSFVLKSCYTGEQVRLVIDKNKIFIYTIDGNVTGCLNKYTTRNDESIYYFHIGLGHIWYWPEQRNLDMTCGYIYKFEDFEKLPKEYNLLTEEDKLRLEGILKKKIDETKGKTNDVSKDF